MDKEYNGTSPESYDGINIEVSGGKYKKLELDGKEQLERILKQYDLALYLFTNHVVIESHIVPHSFPVLTLNTRHVDNDDQSLSVFIHEQLHWYVDLNWEKGAAKAIQELTQMYQKVPVGHPEGGDTESSTHSHLLVNFLEFEELKKIIGVEKATKVIADKDYYTWIYKTVLEEYEKIKKIAQDNNLLLEDKQTSGD